MSDVTGTAYWIAAARARETERPDRLFADPYAARLAGERGRLILDRTGPDGRFIPVRTRWFDDVVVDWTGRHPDGQVVLLGAGLDTRAYRLAIPDTVRVFEVDHAEVLEHKASVVAGRTVPVPADLTGDWTGALEVAGYDRGVPALWLAEGVFFYLPAETVREILRAAAERSAPGSRFVADIFGTGLAKLSTLPESVRRKAFRTDEPAALFVDAGWDAAHAALVGSPEANYGRIPTSFAGPVDPTMRAYLVTGTR